MMTSLDSKKVVFDLFLSPSKDDITLRNVDECQNTKMTFY
jgi:hypothetical protein